MIEFKSSRRMRLFLNWLIRHFNNHLPMEERIVAVPLVPFFMQQSTRLEAATWAYYNLIQDEYADWRDENSVRKDEIAAEIKGLLKKHNKELLEYLEPYRDVHPKDATYAERHRSRVAYDLFHSHRGAAENE